MTEKRNGAVSETPTANIAQVKETMRILKSENLFEQISSDIGDIGIAGEEQLRLMLYVIMTSRLLDKPLSGIIQGASSSGKSYTLETVAKLMPSDQVVQAHDFTEQALYYLPHGSLRHKVVIAGERLHKRHGKSGQASDNSKAFREMVGSGVLRKAVTVKGSEGKFVTQQIEQPGPIAYLESTTATKINDEDATRLLPLVTDESAEQTALVIETMRSEAKGNKVNKTERQEIIERHHAMQRLLKPLEVRIPFIDKLSLPTTSIATRRTFGQLRSMIQAVALLRQFQKEIKHHDATDAEFIEADADDYEVVHDLMKPILERVYSQLDQKSLDMLGILLDKTAVRDGDVIKEYQSFTNPDCQKWTGLSESTVRRRLTALKFAGIVYAAQFGNPRQWRIIQADSVSSVDVGLPKPEEICLLVGDELTNTS
ncbi:hypothetical protein ACFL5Z_17370 [Planctomycetota bacterium]